MPQTAADVTGAVDLDRAGLDDVASPGEIAWLLLVPALALAVPLVVLLAPLLGRLAFPQPAYTFWDTGPVARKPTVQAGYALTAALAVAYAGAIVLVARRGVRLPRRLRVRTVVAIQLCLAAFAVVCWIAQRGIEYGGISRVYFTWPTLVVAALLALATWWVARPAAPDAVRALIAGLAAERRATRLACLGAALLLTVVWLLPTVYTESGLMFGPGDLFGNAYAFDEASAILNGRSTLVDMVAYGTLWPYVVALPLAAFDNGYTAFTAIMATLTGLGLLAVYGVLRRVTRSSAFALALYLPILASSFFIERGTLVARYDPGNYFGVFPLRYTGPYLLVWLVARYVDPRPARRLPPEPLFLLAGLVALNNFDFGFSALAATGVALLLVRRPGESLRRLARGAAAGLAGAFALVSLVTLLRAGSLPHVDLLVRYGRIFVNGGYGNVALPALGLHLAMTATFVAALASAAVRSAAGARDGVLTAALAWVGVFGLGASVYYYAYRSHPDVLINLFSVWSLALALLLVVVLRGARRGARRWPTLPQLAVLLGFGVAACSLAQLPLPWQQVDRMARTAPQEPFRMPQLTEVVAAETEPGERVVVFTPVGHRVADAAGVVNVNLYTGLGQMPSREQLDEVLALLLDEGGTKVFVGEPLLFDADVELGARGFARVAQWQGIGWTGLPVTLYEAQTG